MPVHSHPTGKGDNVATLGNKAEFVYGSTYTATVTMQLSYVHRCFTCVLKGYAVVPELIVSTNILISRQNFGNDFDVILKGLNPKPHLLSGLRSLNMTWLRHG